MPEPVKLVIDGDGADWAPYRDSLATEGRINKVIYVPRPPADTEANTIAVFNCIADARYLYFLFEVKDSCVVFGESPINESFLDDCIEIDLQAKEKLWLRLTADASGQPSLTGLLRSFAQQAPYLPELSGVLAGISKRNVPGKGSSFL